MRITGGEFRGRRLAAPRGLDVRPTGDKVREAVFNLLGDIEGMSVLDLFAGTGALGLEALSRGAVHATFVEVDREASEVVRRNIDACISDDRRTTDLRKGDAVLCLHDIGGEGNRFDLVFFDPPYETTADLIDEVGETLLGVCVSGTRIVLELSTRHAPLVEHATRRWAAELITSRRYGDTTVAILAL